MTISEVETEIKKIEKKLNKLSIKELKYREKLDKCYRMYKILFEVDHMVNTTMPVKESHE